MTIVGGQPSKKRQKGASGTIQVPVGLEKLLFFAARDSDFKQALLDDPASAIAQKKVTLRPSEQAMLKVVSKETLASMIDNVVPENPRRRKFMGLVAAAAASLAAGTTEGCVDSDRSDVVKGSRPDTDNDTVDTEVTEEYADGSRPDTDVDTVDTDQPEMDAGGIGPDTDTDTVDTDQPQMDAGPDADTVDANLPNDGARGVRPDTDVDGGA